RRLRKKWMGPSIAATRMRRSERRREEHAVTRSDLSMNTGLGWTLNVIRSRRHCKDASAAISSNMVLYRLLLKWRVGCPPRQRSILFSKLAWAGGEGSAADRYFSRERSAGAFTPAVILFIAPPEPKDNSHRGDSPAPPPRQCPVCRDHTIIGHGRR